MRKHLIFLLFLVWLVFPSCSKEDNFSSFSPSNGRTDIVTPVPRGKTESNRRVLLYVSAGYNSLSGYLDQNLKTLEKSYLPQGKDYNADVLLVLIRKPAASGDYSTPSAARILRLYADSEGKPVRDTLRQWEGSQAICTPELFGSALDYVFTSFPAKSYGMIFSSHALGWLPPNYEGVQNGGLYWVPGRRSIGQDKTSAGSEELSLEDFTNAIPGRFDYILFDACLLGCVEVAWQLRGKADLVGFSPTEILAKGFDYSTLTQRLLPKSKDQEPDPVGVCQDYFAQYDPDGDATISVVDTRKMQPLADVCRELIESYRTDLAYVSTSRVQRYFRPAVTPNCVCLYDLEDILVQAGIEDSEIQRLEEALSEAVIYKNTTPKFLSISIQRYSGLSMYLPKAGEPVLDTYYKEHIAWNQAVGLVL